MRSVEKHSNYPDFDSWQKIASLTMSATRKRDRKRATTHDAILVHLVGGKIATWNEYFGY